MARPLRAIESQLSVIVGCPDVVASACADLAESLARAADPELALYCEQRLAAQLAGRGGEVVRPLFEHLVGAAERADRPAPLIPPLLAVRDAELQARAGALLARLVAAGRLAASAKLVAGIAQQVEGRPGPPLGDEVLAAIEQLLRTWPTAVADRQPRDPIEELLLVREPASRLLAARLLDRHGTTPRPAVVKRALGESAATFLTPYLEFTGASHRDLVALTPDGPGAFPALAPLRGAQSVLGRPLLADLIGRLGWRRVCRGIAVERWIGLSSAGSFPLLVSDAEAALLEECGPARRLWERLLIVTWGDVADATSTCAIDERVQRFQRYSVTHAELLAEILEVAPLTARKARRIVERLGVIVDDFAALFHEHTEDTAAVHAVYGALRDAVVDALRGDDDELQPAETMRLVQMFEEPQTIDEVRTLHGLKRYLHRQGLRLAFRLFQSGAANRTVDLVVATPERILSVCDRIRFIDFDPERAADDPRLPLPVALIVEAFGRQLLHGHTPPPRIEVLIYGNEVHVYAHFRNHPALIRIDFSPPLRGGMIDLEYFGVSKYELEHHPRWSLEGIQTVFRRLDFEVEVEGHRLRFRYDKERAFDLGDVIDHARALFCVVPYLMDFDWIIGDLAYPEPARQLVGEAWADFLIRWGTLPTEALLTPDRRRIVREIVPDPAGPRAVAWTGDGAYRDRFTGTPPTELIPRLRDLAEQRGIAGLIRWEHTVGALGQIALERALLKPLRRALERGELLRWDDRALLPVSADLFRRDQGAERLAALLAEGGAALERGARLAELVSLLERSLRWRQTGSIEGYRVEEAALRLRHARVALHVLRDGVGSARVAIAALSGVLFSHRDRAEAPWIRGPELDPDALLLRLREDGYLGAETDLCSDARARATDVLKALETPSAGEPHHHEPGDRVVFGIPAAPGRAAGVALFRAPREHPEDLEGAVLVASAIRPEDAPLLRHAAAIVSTGGSVLSHAGLIALELCKPALVIGGRWIRSPEERPQLLYRRTDYREEQLQIGRYRVELRRDLREHQELLEEGDLVVVDGNAGCLTVLGHDRDALVLQRELRRLEQAAARLMSADDPQETLLLRGGLLRATHQLEKLLARIHSPALARHAVQELLLARGDAEQSSAPAERRGLLGVLFANPACRVAAQRAAQQRLAVLAAQHDALAAHAQRALSAARNLFELLFVRLAMIRRRQLLDDVTALLAGHGVAPQCAVREIDIDGLARVRLEQLRDELGAALPVGELPPETLCRARATLQGIARIDAAIGSRSDAESAASLAAASRAVQRCERESLAAVAQRLIVAQGDGGAELAPLVGVKAANLGEVGRQLGDRRVPRWFALCDRAFRIALAAPLAHNCALESLICGAPGSLGQAIESLVVRHDLPLARRSAAIRALWQICELPAPVAEAITAAYRALAAGSLEQEPFVAIRSSAFEEDRESSSWAGQFDTFLFIRGASHVLEHVKLAWAGLWSERALAHRDSSGHGLQPLGGGIVVQRTVCSRVSGVLLSASAAHDRPPALVINVGLGLGEGVVSGLVDVDHIVVSKEGDLERDPICCSYTVGDKREQVIFDAHAGLGTRRTETRYHQRLRPALEYVELTELVRVAARLEAAFGQPLDIEFAFDDAQLCILQLRPVSVFHAALRETSARYPIRRRPAREAQEQQR